MPIANHLDDYIKSRGGHVIREGDLVFSITRHDEAAKGPPWEPADLAHVGIVTNSRPYRLGDEVDVNEVYPYAISSKWGEPAKQYRFRVEISGHLPHPNDPARPIDPSMRALIVQQANTLLYRPGSKFDGPSRFALFGIGHFESGDHVRADAKNANNFIFIHSCATYAYECYREAFGEEEFRKFSIDFKALPAIDRAEHRRLKSRFNRKGGREVVLEKSFPMLHVGYLIRWCEADDHPVAIEDLVAYQDHGRYIPSATGAT